MISRAPGAATGNLSEMRATTVSPLFLAVLIGLGLLIGACDRGAAPPAKLPEPTHVLTTVYALADIVREVGGTRVTVEWFVESGQSLEQLSETPQRRQQAQSADLIVTRGAADPWTLEGSGNAYQDRRILRVDTLPAARDGDPTQYMWLDPQVVLELTDEIAARLSNLEPQSEKLFRANAAKFRAQVIVATDRARPLLDRSNGAFLTLNRGFLPLARRMGLTNVEVPAIELNDPSPYGVKVLKKTAADAGAKAIFTSAQTPITLLHDWESRLGLMVLPLDGLGSSAPSGRSTYLAILDYDLNQLVTGLQNTRPAGATTR